MYRSIDSNGRIEFPSRPKSIEELLRFAGIHRHVDDQNKIITVSRQAINNHRHMSGIFACIDEIRYQTSWEVKYQEDDADDEVHTR